MTSMADHTPPQHPNNKMASSRPSSPLKTSTASKLGICCSQDASSMTQVVLWEIPTRIFLPDPFCTIVNHANGKEHNPNHQNTPHPDRGSTPFSSHLPQWCDCDDKENLITCWSLMPSPKHVNACNNNGRWPKWWSPQTPQQQWTPANNPSCPYHTGAKMMMRMVIAPWRLTNSLQNVTTYNEDGRKPRWWLHRPSLNQTPTNNLLSPTLTTPLPILRSLITPMPWKITPSTDLQPPMATECSWVLMPYLCYRQKSWQNALSWLAASLQKSTYLSMPPLALKREQHPRALLSPRIPQSSNPNLSPPPIFVPTKKLSQLNLPFLMAAAHCRWPEKSTACAHPSRLASLQHSMALMWVFWVWFSLSMITLKSKFFPP